MPIPYQCLNKKEKGKKKKINNNNKQTFFLQLYLFPLMKAMSMDVPVLKKKTRCTFPPKLGSHIGEVSTYACSQNKRTTAQVVLYQRFLTCVCLSRV